MAAMKNEQLFATEGTGKSTIFEESKIASPVRASTPVQDPSPNRVSSPVRDPSPIRVPTPVRYSSPEQAPICVTDPIPTETPIPVRSLSPSQIINDTSFSVKVEQAFDCFVQWKSYRVAAYDVLYNSQVRLKGKNKSIDTAPSSSYNNDSDDNDDAFQAGLRMNREEAHEESVLSIQHTTFYTLASEPIIINEPSAIPQEDSVPPQDQAEAERHQEDSIPHVPSSTEHHLPESPVPQDEEVPHPYEVPPVDAPASPCSQPDDEFLPEDSPKHPTHHVVLRQLKDPEDKLARPDSSRSEQRKERLEALGLQTVFIHDAIDALYKHRKMLDWLKVSAAEEIGTVKSELSDMVDALRALSQLLKVAISNLQQRQDKILEEEQAKLGVCEAKTVTALKESGSRLTGHDQKINNLSLLVHALADKFSNIKEKHEEIPHGYRVSGSRPEFHDPNVPWKISVQSPTEINLPTYRQPSPEEIKHWRKNELMRYFVKLIREYTLFDRCKSLSESTKEFDSQLERGVIPLQLAMISKHRKGDRVTHPEDWIISFDKSYERRAVYLNRGKDAFKNWWKDTEFDPKKKQPRRHEHEYKK
ncbi:hypothetical protein OROMI_025061 [Orobanche minor]